MKNNTEVNTKNTQEIISAIGAIISEAERMRNAYFFDSPRTASSRRSYEKQHSHPKIEWIDGMHVYTAEYVVSCSCKNVYAFGNYTRDGKKTTLTAIRNSYKRLIA